MFGLGIEEEKVFGSKWLITELNKLGFSISSNEITRYKQSVVFNDDISDYLKDVMPGSFCQWSADNVDHNILSIDGKGSLYAMGIILSSTSSFSNDSTNLKPVVRQKLRKADDVIQDKIIPIKPYEPNILGLSLIKLRPMAELFVSNSLPKDILLDLV